MHQAMLYEKLTDGRVRCNTCRWRCKIGIDKTGVCRMYQNKGGELYNLNYAQVSSVAIDPIEKKPLFHFFSGSTVFSLGGWGCNFHCRDCQNWEISCVDLPQKSRQIQPMEAVMLAKEYNCRGIAWTYNEPTVWFEYTLDSAKLAKENGLYTAYVTNGYMTTEALDAIGPYLDAYRVDIKGFNDRTYKVLAKISNWEGILDNAKRAKFKWNMHVEVVTNVVPGINDDDVQLEGIARFIKEELGELTPWHVTRFYPNYNMMNVQPTAVETLEHAIDIGKKAGLKFVYAGNIPGHNSENTTCYSCGKIVIRRYAFQTEILGLKGGNCVYCGADLNIRTDTEVTL
ncbi:MAG: AmmeMemoRadiSam system radical SAM enzyme [Dehalococcoidales bacterium]|nr:AmmeMemoRadiSam system radical SAM enzyme [Dehalococcoidales bacterium]